MSINVTTLDYKNYGKCVCIENGTIQVYVSVDVGPRILWYGFVGGENLLYNDVDRTSAKRSKDIADTFGEGEVFQFYGGHRMWTSPEDPVLSYYPDCHPVKWEQTENGVKFTAEPQPVNDVRHSMEIVMSDSNELKVLHEIENLRDKEQTYATWGITQYNHGGIQIIPQLPRYDSLAANRIIAFWSYVNFDDERINYGRDFVTLKTADMPSMKIGFNNASGWSCYVNQGAAIIKRFDYDPSLCYPDFGCNYETYTDRFFIEMECLGPSMKLKKGESAKHTETWIVKKCDEMPSFTDQENIAAFVEKYVKD